MPLLSWIFTCKPPYKVGLLYCAIKHICFAISCSSDAISISTISFQKHYSKQVKFYIWPDRQGSLVRLVVPTTFPFNSILPFRVFCTCFSHKNNLPRISEHWWKRRWKSKQKNWSCQFFLKETKESSWGANMAWSTREHSEDQQSGSGIPFLKWQRHTTGTISFLRSFFKLFIYVEQCFRKITQRGSGTSPGYWHQSSSAHSKTQSWIQFVWKTDSKRLPTQLVKGILKWKTKGNTFKQGYEASTQ